MATPLSPAPSAALNFSTPAANLRHDPYDAVEEALHDGEFHEVIVSTLPRQLSRWLHADLPSRIAHLGLPVQTVTAEG